jgi:hypothetical protein
MGKTGHGENCHVHHAVDSAVEVRRRALGGCRVLWLVLPVCMRVPSPAKLQNCKTLPHPANLKYPCPPRPQHGLLVENLLDLAHAPFTHTSTFARGWPVPEVVRFHASKLLAGNWCAPAGF